MLRLGFLRINYILMVPLMGFLAVFQSVVGPKLQVMGVRPDLILLVVILWTLLNGSSEGMVWAFAGGLWMDVFSGGPMGGSSLALIAASVVVGVGHNRLFYTNPVVPIAAALLGTMVYAVVYLGILSLVGHAMPFGQTVWKLVLPSAVYNTALMVLITPLLSKLPAYHAVDSLG